MTTTEKAYLLESATHWEGSEVGDFWVKLTDMYLYQKDYLSEHFHLQVGLEVETQYQYLLDMIDDGDLEINDEDLLEQLK